ncbi:MAG: SDR family NAD(P)-dependent oxidoreductase, partial [Pseudomonadota bacterium]|nr:SDR family NAD(P)-dependent oxidoreductase [Pseudomonadota bacterium]
MKVKAENHPVAGVAFITGGGGGIGGATAERLAANGVSVVVADFNAKLSEAVAERIISRGGRALPMAVDV